VKVPATNLVTIRAEALLEGVDGAPAGVCPKRQIRCGGQRGGGRFDLLGREDAPKLAHGPFGQSGS
jgi:hypothetical protein